MYNIVEIKAMQYQALQLNLKYPEAFLRLPAHELKSIFNGYGPDFWHPACRKMLSWIFRHYPTPAAIHDLRYEFADGIEPTRKAADAEFAANLLLVWKARYKKLRFINPIAWFDYWKITAAGRLTCRFGRRAWLESYRMNKGAVQ